MGAARSQHVRAFAAGCSLASESLFSHPWPRQNLLRACIMRKKTVRGPATLAALFLLATLAACPALGLFEDDGK